MADFSVGNAPRPADYAGPIMNLGQQIAQLPGQYYAGKQAEAEMRLRQAFPNGIPRDARGQIDVAAAMDIFAKNGGGQSVAPLMQTLMYSQAGTDAAGVASDAEAGAPSYGGPAPGPQTSAPPAPGGPQVAAGPPPAPALPPAQQPSPVANDGAPTLRTVIAETAGANNDSSKVIGTVARELKINPDKPLTPQELEAAKPIIKQRLAAADTKTTTDAGRGPPFAPMIPRDGSKPPEETRPPSGPVAGPTPAGPSQAGPPGQPGAPVGPGGPVPGAVPPPVPPPAPQAPPPPQQVAQAAPPPPPRALGSGTSHIGTPLEGLVPEGMTVGQFIDGNNKAAGALAARAIQVGKLNGPGATALSKRAEQIEARNKPVLDAMAKAGEQTPDQKNARASGVANPLELEGARTRGKGVDEALGKNVASAIEKGGQDALKRIQMLDTIGDALVQGGGNITTGPAAEMVLKGKQFISSLFGIDVAGQSESEVISKSGFGLASLAVKEITNRPTQMEVKLALTNNPGLLLGPKGSMLMIDVMKQTARQDIALARLAAKSDPRDWPEKLEEFYDKNPLKSPFTGKPLGKEDLKILADPAQNPVPPQAQAAIRPSLTEKPMTFSKPEELDAAIKSGVVKDGQLVTDGKRQPWPVVIPKVQQ